MSLLETVGLCFLLWVLLVVLAAFLWHAFLYFYDRRHNPDPRRIPISRPRRSLMDRDHPLHVLGARRGPGPEIDHPTGKPRLP